MKTATLLLSLFALTPACVSQQPGKAVAKDPLVVEAGEMQLSALIDRCAAYLDCNILCSAQEMAQTGQPAVVRLQKALSLDRDGCEEFLTSMLYRSGFALVSLDEKGTMLEVISMMGPRAREVTARAVERTPEQVLARPNLKVMVTTVVPMEHVNATIATNALRPFFASTGAPGGGGSLTLGNVGGSKSLLLSGMQDQVAQAIRLVRKCDVPGGMDGMGMGPGPGGGGDDRVAQLEKRVKMLEEQLNKQKAPADDKAAEKAGDKAGDKGNTKK